MRFQLLILIRKNGKKFTFYVERHSFAYLITNLHINEYCLSLIILEMAFSYSLTFISLIRENGLKVVYINDNLAAILFIQIRWILHTTYTSKLAQSYSLILISLIKTFQFFFFIEIIKTWIFYIMAINLHIWQLICIFMNIAYHLSLKTDPILFTDVHFIDKGILLLNIVHWLQIYKRKQLRIVAK